MNEWNKIYALSCHTALRTTLQFSENLFLHRIRLFLALFVLLFGSPFYSSHFRHVNASSSQLYSDSLGRQTSINDCLSRNIDDLTNSQSASTLYIYPFVSHNMNSGSRIQCKHYLLIFHVLRSSKIFGFVLWNILRMSAQ